MTKTKTPAPVPPKPEYNEKAVYTGRRLQSNGEVWHRFEKPNGEEMYFGKTQRVYIGHTYACGKSNIARRPERDYGIERVDNPEWDAADALVDAHRARRRAEAKAKATSSPALKNASAALAPLFKGLDYFQRRYLIEYLANSLDDRGKVRKKRK